MSEQTNSMMPSSTPEAAPEALIEKAAQELAPTPKVEPKQEEIDYSSRFAALSRREKQLIEREKRLKDVEVKAKDSDSKLQSWETRKAELKKNPDLIFEEIGMSFEDLVSFKLGVQEEAEKKNLDPNELYKKIKADLEAELQNKFKEKEDSELKAKEEAEIQKSAQIIESFKKDIEDTIKSQTDKYEIINYQGDYNLVYEVIENYFNEHNEVLPLEEAANHVESYLEELVEGATKLKKIQSKFAPKVETPTQPTSKASEISKAIDNTPKTLSNSLQSSSSTSLSGPIDIEESKRRAAALLRWK